jgi:hypothetical protein
MEPVFSPIRKTDSQELTGLYTQEGIHEGIHEGTNISHPPFIPPIKGGNIPSPLVGEGKGEGYFGTNDQKPVLSASLYYKIVESTKL